MAELLQSIASVATLVFVVSCMATAGLGLRLSEIVAPLSRGRLVLAAIAANFLIAPGIAYGLTLLVPLERPHAIGLLLLGGAAGAPFLPKLAEAARGDAAFSVGLMLLLMAGSVAFMPLALPLMIPGLTADAWPILKPLLLTMLLPLSLGVAMKNWFEGLATRIAVVSGRLSTFSMVLAVLLLMGLNATAMLGTFGTGAVAVGMIFVTLSLGAGYVLGGSSPTLRSTMSLGTGQRNIAAAMLLATENFREEPGVMAMLLVSTFTGLAILMFAARRFAYYAPH